VSAAAVRRWAAFVLKGEGVGGVTISITFLPDAEMQLLNARVLGVDRPTDVIAFRMDHLDRAAGDIYICPDEARRSAREAGCTSYEETRRLVVHGVLHVLGHDHPEDASRVRSPMWALQERYVAALEERSAP
jgi:probable rRNA maturation factor